MKPIKEDEGNSNDVQTLLIMLSCCGELNLDSKALAGAFGISRTDNALRKIKQVFGKHGYRYENGKVIRIDSDGFEDFEAVEKPKKKLTLGHETTRTPTPKKCKRKETARVGDEENEDARAGDDNNMRTKIEEDIV